jgi:YYY domain-containing protein
MLPKTESLPSDYSTPVGPSKSPKGSETSRPLALTGVQVFLLIAILLVGALLRLYNIAWDSGTLPHPDERSTVAFYAPSIRWPGDLKTAFDPRRSTLNPFWDVNSDHRRSYTYGHFPLYTLVLTAGAAESLAPLAEGLGLPEPLVHILAEAQSMAGYAFIGRFLVAIADVASIYLVFLIGRRLYRTWAGLLAAALLAFTVLHIQLSHFFAVDPVSATFTLLALYGSMLMYDRRSVGASVLTGVGIGLAVASKYSALPIIAAPLVAVALSVMRAALDERGAVFRLALRNLVIAGVVSFIVFAVTSPFVFLDFESFWQVVVKEQGDMVSGVADFPFTRQYRGTPAYLYFIEQQIRWGMGWPLGLLAFAGLTWVVIRAILGRAKPGEWILLSWVVLYFGPTGLFLAKFMRYMVPVVPLFILFGVGLVASLASGNLGIRESGNQGISESGNRETGESGFAFHVSLFTFYFSLVIALVVLLVAAIWSLAFVNGVYGTPHSWVTASRWVYENVPDGTCIAVEHWEEGFPRSWGEPGMNPGAHQYHQPSLPMYEEDTRGKFETIRDTLRDCDYLVLASNRLWRTIPRLPERYPMSTRYYQALFDGELGFEEIYSLDTPPRLGPLVFDDQDADESFTVYDHPRPVIFKKTRQLSDAEWEALLGDAWQGAVHGYVGPPTLLARLRGRGERVPDPVSNSADSESRKSLLLDRPVDELPVVDDYHWNSLANRSTLAAIVIWWLAVQVVGWLTWPLTHRLFRRLPDLGYPLSKSLGWLLVGYGVWLISSLRIFLPVGPIWGNTLPTIIGVVVVLGVVSAWLGLRGRRGDANTVEKTSYSLLPTSYSLKLILPGEAVFTLVYLFFIGLRLLNPDLWQPWNGGEKMLEIGFLNAIVKSIHMPPYDPYYAGGYINYYYYGLFLVSVLVKLTGIQPAIAFNLAVPTLAGLTAAGVFSLGYNLVRRPSPSTSRALTVGALAVLLVVFVGNLAGLTQLVDMLGEHGGSSFESALPGLEPTVRALVGLKSVLIEGTKLPPYNYWDPSRVIPDTINEFPYWSFLFADLHPHMIGIPFTVLFLSLAYTWLRPVQTPNPKSQVSNHQSLISNLQPRMSPLKGTMRALSLEGLEFLHKFSWGYVLRWLALPLCLGALAVINTWDLPTYLGVITLTFWLARYREGAKNTSEDHPLEFRRLLIYTWEALLFGALTLAASYFLYLPFFANYQPLDVGLGIVHDKTVLGQFIKIWGLPLFVAVSYLVFRLVYPRSRMGALRTISLFLRRWNVAPHMARMYSALVRPTGYGYWAVLWSLVLVVGVAIILWVLGYRVPAFLLPLVWLSFLLLLRPEPDSGQAFAGLLLFTGLLLLLGVEFFFLRDFLGGSSYYRMNTLFKFYIQVWVMLGVASAYLVAFLWNTLLSWERAPHDRPTTGPAPTGDWGRVVLSLAWQLVLMLLIVATLVYPALGTPTRVRDRFDRSPPRGTLNGMAYMTVGTLVWPQDNHINLEYDYEAIRWLQENVKGTPVLAEAKIGFYREGGMRVASYTGLPTPLGGLHQNEQRWPEQIAQRDGRYMEFWNTTDLARAWELIQELGISYIYLGQLEQTLYNPQLTGSLIQWGVTYFVPDGIDKFDMLVDQGLLTVAYENERTRIYQVTGNR